MRNKIRYFRALLLVFLPLSTVHSFSFPSKAKRKIRYGMQQFPLEARSRHCHARRDHHPAKVLVLHLFHDAKVLYVLPPLLDENRRGFHLTPMRTSKMSYQKSGRFFSGVNCHVSLQASIVSHFFISSFAEHEQDPVQAVKQNR
jgi:hypothetical protein